MRIAQRVEPRRRELPQHVARLRRRDLARGVRADERVEIPRAEHRSEHEARSDRRGVEILRERPELDHLLVAAEELEVAHRLRDGERVAVIAETLEMRGGLLLEVDRAVAWRSEATHAEALGRREDHERIAVGRRAPRAREAALEDAGRHRERHEVAAALGDQLGRRE